MDTIFVTRFLHLGTEKQFFALLASKPKAASIKTYVSAPVNFFGSSTLS